MRLDKKKANLFAVALKSHIEKLQDEIQFLRVRESDSDPLAVYSEGLKCDFLTEERKVKHIADKLKEIQVEIKFSTAMLQQLESGELLAPFNGMWENLRKEIKNVKDDYETDLPNKQTYDHVLSMMDDIEKGGC